MNDSVTVISKSGFAKVGEAVPVTPTEQPAPETDIASAVDAGIGNVEVPSALTRYLRRRMWFILFVIVPTLLAAVYYSFIASDEYVSEARFTIKNPGQRSAQVTSLASLIQTTGLSSGQEQANEVLDYLHSRAALVDLSKRLDVRGMYASRGADFLSRFPRPWSKDRFETLYKYYLGMVDASMDTSTNIAVVKVRAFTPEDAYRINTGLLNLSEEMVNRLSDRAQHHAIAEAERRVKQAEARLRKARIAMSRYRNDEKLLDPAKQATGVLEISNHLVSEQAALQAQLDLMTRVAPANPAIPAIRNQIDAIGRAIASQDGRAVGTSGALAEKLPGYENVAVEQDFATQNYTVASAALEQARLEAQKQQFYLERVASPDKPDMAQLPRRFRMILTIAAAALCLYFVGWMLVVGILEHAPED
jgi:capsular polysaccharide transport system permease protein